jgi:16S rRNA (cytosine967-C5)-methyltransferase
MIAPARRAAYDALLAHVVSGTDLAAAVSAVRRGLTEPRDQTLLTELVSGTVRMRGAIDHQLALRCTRPLDALDAAVLTSLRLGAFQLMYLDRVPASAAVNDAVALTRRGGKTSAGGMVNAVLRALSRDREKLVWPDGPEPLSLAVRYSHPEWLVERWLARYGSDRTRRWLAFNNEAPQLCLATNRLYGTRDELKSRLLGEGVTTEPTGRAEHGLLVVDGPALNTDAFREGRFVVQDEASQLITELGAIAPGHRVLDLCAAPGGKTVALSARCAPGGQVVACDVRPRRVRLLRATLQRTGRAEVPVVQVASAGDLPFSAGAFDAVLVDAPCSGLGTLRRDPDIRWGRRAEDLPRLAAAQLTLVSRAAALVKSGGQLIYSTCSSEPDENEEVVAAFLADAPEFSLVSDHKTLPPDDGLEAFYGAVIARNL